MLKIVREINPKNGNEQWVIYYIFDIKILTKTICDSY